MNAVEEPALEKSELPVAAVIPEASKSGLPEVKADYGAGEFWKEEGAPDKKPEAAIPEKKEVVTADDAPPTGIAAKLAAKAKPAEAVKPVAAVIPEAAPEDKLALDPKSSPKARENFENLRTITKTVREQLNAKEKELAALRTKAPLPADNAEQEKLRTEHKAMSDKLLLIDIQNHPVFQQQYVAPRREALAQATELLKAHGKEADLAALIEKPRGEIGKALSEILKDVPAFDQSEISSHVQKAYQLAQGEKQALAQARDVSGAIRQQDSTTHVQAFDKTWDKVAAGVTEMLTPAEIPANASASDREHIQSWNEAVQQLRSNAKHIATGAASYESIADASIRAAAYDLHVKHVLPRIGVEVAAMQEVITGLKKEVEGYRSRNPNREISPKSAGPEKPDANINIEEAAEAAWR